VDSVTGLPCPECGRPFGSPEALRQHQRDKGHGSPEWPAVTRGRRRGGRRTRPAGLTPHEALELVGDDGSDAAVAMAMELAGYEPGALDEFCADAAEGAP
jgi:hypothetical protein